MGREVRGDEEDASGWAAWEDGGEGGEGALVGGGDCVDFVAGRS